MKKWEIKNELRVNSDQLTIEKTLEILLENRGLKTKKEINDFVHPTFESVTSKSVGIDQKELARATKRVKKAIEKKEQVIVFGDYDVDGITGAAILWETLHSLGANVFPYIPHRIDEGYGLSVKGIKNILASKVGPLSRSDLSKTKLIITVDNGIVANDAVDFANKQGIDVIITDHHVPSKKLPKAFAIVHTVQVCGAAVGYFFAREIRVILNSVQDLGSNGMLKSIRQAQDPEYIEGQVQHDSDKNHLELVALATVADLVPLKAANRTLLIFGLEELRKTKRIGLLELCKEAVLDPKTIGVYEIGHIIAPRLNASGRLESAMDSLRLLCTTDKKRAEDLAFALGGVNRERQQVTIETTMHAVSKIKDQKSKIKNLLFVQDQTYQAGVIGLVAGRLVEEFYRPSIVLAVGETYAKASARSISGFNIIEFIRTASHLLVDAGGHPMAAGFTVEIEKIAELQKHFEEKAQDLLSSEMFERKLSIDLELPLDFVSEKLYSQVQALSPFGMGNPEPTFVSRGALVQEIRTVGQGGKHLKIRIKPSATSNQQLVIEGIGFGLGDQISKIKSGSKIDIVYTITENVWNNNKTLQLKIRDLVVL